MGDPYGLPEDLRRLISSRTTTLLPPHHHDPLSLHHHPLNAPPHPNNCYDPINFVVGNNEVFFPPRASSSSSFPHHYHAYNNSSSSSPLNPTTAITTTPTSSVVAASDHAFCSSSLDTAEKGWLGFDSGTNRWPRQETLSLLEIRSRLDSKFRENNQKAPLWNEISRIMAEEFGYQRSGKKCKEKFENLYKYYKKTKEGKASRHDGKHYRFFRQLEAICGEASSTHPSTSDKSHHHHHHHAAGNTNTAGTVQTPSFKISQDGDNHHHHGNNNLKSSESLSFSNSSELETSSSENNNDEDLSAIAYMLKNSRGDNSNQKGLDNNLIPSHHHHHGRDRRSWRAKVEEIVGSHMRKIIETQDAWMERMLSVVEQREQEMASKEEERKKKETMRFDQEVHELWAKERAWVEARDAALLEVVRKHIGNDNNNINNRELELALPFDGATVGTGNNNKNKSLLQQATATNDDGNEYHNSGGGWSEMEISNLIQLRTGFEQRLRENGYLENGVWDEIAAKLACLGFERSAAECKQIWDEISISLGRTVECGAKTRPWCLGLKLTDDDIDL